MCVIQRGEIFGPVLETMGIEEILGVPQHLQVLPVHVIGQCSFPETIEVKWYA